MPLKAIKPTDAGRSRAKISIFGAPGVGKTWGAMGFPGVYYVCTEPGNQLPQYMQRLEQNGGIYFGPDQGASDPDEVLEQVRALAEGGHPYKTLVIDSVTKIFQSIVTSEQERLGDKDQFGASKKPAVAWMRSLIIACDRLDMNVVYVHHEKPIWAMGEQIGVGADGWEKTAYELNLEFNIQNTGEIRQAIVTKSREPGFQLHQAFPWSYEEFAKRFGDADLAAASAAYSFATEDQITRLETLIGTLQIAEETQAKWLKKLGVEQFRDADSNRLETLIGGLVAKLNPDAGKAAKAPAKAAKGPKK